MSDLHAEVAALRAEVAELRELIRSLKPVAEPDHVPEEISQIISAVVAAYLGKRATVKFIRETGSEADSWSIQGRMAIQGSHRLD